MQVLQLLLLRTVLHLLVVKLLLLLVLKLLVLKMLHALHLLCRSDRGNSTGLLGSGRHASL